MATPLIVCTMEEQRTVVRFLWLEGMSVAEIHRKLSTQYGDSALPRRRVYECIEKFKSDRTINFKAQSCAGKLLHGNARPHMAGQTVETINHLAFEVLERPAYSPYLAPSDCHLSGPIKDALRGRRFSTDKEVWEAVDKWLRDQPKTFLEVIRKLVDHWTKCIEKKDYVEK
ncbi:hypothetical protein B7P43_G06769 [Cryptotermes secundus]|uniref:Mos1 transposase HTH domain-containing protein n=1 Tax=Cryptotermes secundus TaxID=105785 RepID=A0A2J7PKJ5_9NEOP|nr:hypothetical protein B7P43_G06769 [Cryptotermes secundus]